MKRALITGITGQDGAYLSKLLLDKGYKVTGVSPQHSTMNYWRLTELGLVGNTGNHPNLYLETMDITCPASIRSILHTPEDGTNYDEVYNLAAQSFVPESFSSPASTLAVNITGTLNILEAIVEMPEYDRPRFYQASTSEMFGLVNVEAQDEQTPFHPRSPYAVSKAAAHYLVQNYREAYGVHASCGILFNHESPLRGIEFVTRKVTDGIARIVTRKADNLCMGNLDACRDWGHAEDYVYGMWLMLQQDKPDDYVLATGHSHSVKDFINTAFNIVGLNPDNYIKPDARYMRPSDVPLLCGNSTKAKEKLGWEITRSFENLVTSMVHADLYRHGYDPVAAIAAGEIAV